MKLTPRSLVALFLTLGGIAVAQESGRPKIATVDMSALFMEFHQTKDAKSKFEEEKKGVEKQLEERTARLNEAKQELETLQKQLSDPSVSDTKKQTLFADRQVKQQQAESLQREAEEFVQRKQRALQEQMQLRMKNILEAIRAKVQKQAETDGYDYVLDKTGASTSQVPILLYTKDATDITEVLLKSINEGAAAEGKKAEDK